MNKVVLVVAAHSDDEALGCSGTISKHIDNGDSVHLLFMTDGVGSRSKKERGGIRHAHGRDRQEAGDDPRVRR